MSFRVIRGAISIDEDTKDQVNAHTQRLLETIFERNNVSHEQVISIFFTVTSDISSHPPAAAARAVGLVDVPLICAQEMNLAGGVPFCVRVLMHTESDLDKADVRHVFLRGAAKLRPDLAEPGDEVI